MKKRAQLPLTALRAFEVTARHGNVRQACVELFLTPGAVSQQVRALEERAGIQLFDRTGGRYELTTVGSHLLSRLTKCFDELEQALDDVIAQAQPKKLRLKLAPTFASRWLAPRMGNFFFKNSDVDLEVATVSAVSEISFEQCDFVMRFGAADAADLDHVFLFADELVTVCSPEVAKQIKDVSDLDHCTLIHSSFRERNWRQWFESIGVDTFKENVGPKFPNALMAVEAAIGGAGVAITQWVYVKSEVDAGRLVVPLPHRARSDNAYYLASPRYRRHEPKIAAFRQWLESVVDPSTTL